ncbi:MULTISPECIES: hypothetical protein [unclassified Tolypothrix]|uniref:hypothetical protein n=1 Tax=unclassified Tolypothrix TaxID=2649714 RepID=UPI0005EAB048|nr:MULTISPECIES: hypothetical protein [unclassified Tolypothrix]BAY95993.1 hypothetical protein NIES3275_80700 [Microchaete diplosiphon NIES-3275]EKE96766.1 hypothetical protein FDUTEX481_06308 [Tolypothrix sp. PCC 7601]MBE9084920.1 hypothetical protein [Tolypothrix sp. LEGE 11397]UYD31154.1 hypothetical protein HGR01_40465 [Tolypothrix sp. PCC 7712]UYD38950.1 hypothetical protein HG267_41255 [Tolypothrix sp. PCC 7601]
MKKRSKFCAVFFTLAISSINSFFIQSPAKAFEDTTYICNTGKYLVFTRENENNQLVYTAFQGYFDSNGYPEQDPDLILYNGSLRYINDGNQQLMTWASNRGYVYQVIAPTLKAEVELPNYLIVKRNGRVILRQKCR